MNDMPTRKRLCDRCRRELEEGKTSGTICGACQRQTGPSVVLGTGSPENQR